jgi:hypothetical protein
VAVLAIELELINVPEITEAFVAVMPPVIPMPEGN